MSIWGSALARAVGGGGAAVAGLANKYIDDELIQQRQQAFLDMSRQSRNLERADADAFDNDPARLARNRQIQRDNALSAGQTAQDVELGRLTNKPLNEAARTKAAGDADAATTAKIEAMRRMATDPAATEAQRAQAALDLEKLTGEIGARTKGAIDVINATEDARARSGAYDRRGGAEQMKLPPGVKAELDALDKRDEQINAAMVRAQADGMWDPEKNPSQKQLQTQLAATRMRRSQIIQPYLEGGGGAADPLGLRGSKPGGAPAGGGMQPTTGEQGARDVDAGKLMIRSEYGGDVDKARAALARIEAEAAKAQGETRAMMMSEANRLRMGIEAYGKGADKPAKAGDGKGIMARVMEAASGRQSQGKPDTGVEGLSPIALRRIANDPTHPRQKAAQEALNGEDVDASTVNAERMRDPATDPAMYR